MHDEMVSELRLWGAGLFLTIEGAGENHSGWHEEGLSHNFSPIPFWKSLKVLAEVSGKRLTYVNMGSKSSSLQEESHP